MYGKFKHSQCTPVSPFSEGFVILCNNDIETKQALEIPAIRLWNWAASLKVKVEIIKGFILKGHKKKRHSWLRLQEWKYRNLFYK